MEEFACMRSYVGVSLTSYCRLRVRLNIRRIRKIFLAFKISLELHTNYLHPIFAG